MSIHTFQHIDLYSAALMFYIISFFHRIMKVATQFQGRGLNFAVADRQEFQDELEAEFGLGQSEEGDVPLVTIRTREGHKYTMQEEFT